MFFIALLCLQPPGQYPPAQTAWYTHVFILLLMHNHHSFYLGCCAADTRPVPSCTGSHAFVHSCISSFIVSLFYFCTALSTATRPVPSCTGGNDEPTATSDECVRCTVWDAGVCAMEACTSANCTHIHTNTHTAHTQTSCNHVHQLSTQSPQ